MGMDYRKYKNYEKYLKHQSKKFDIGFSTNTYKQVIPGSGKISNKIVRAIMIEK